MNKNAGILLSTKQPSGLWSICISIFFITFGFTTVLTTFGEYSIDVLGFSSNYATALSVGSYLFLVNFTAVAGGVMGQKYSHKKIVFLGGLYAAFGLCLISISNLALMGLAIYAVGTGMMIPNIYTSLSRLYSPDDPRRNAGFTLLFIFINLGVFLNSMISVYSTSFIGYDKSFIFSALFATIGTVLFIKFDRNIPKQPLKIKSTDDTNLSSSDATASLLTIMVLITALIRYLLDNIILNMAVMAILSIFSIFYIFYLAYKHQYTTRKRLLGLLFLIIICLDFWFAERLTSIVFIEYSGLLLHNNIFNWSGAPEDIINILSTLMITIVAIIFAIYWTSKQKGQAVMTLPFLIGLSLLLTSIAFGMLWLGEQAGIAGQAMSASTYLILAVLIMAVAKTITIPLYYGMAGKLAPREHESTLIGIMQLFIGCAGIIAIALTHHTLPHEVVIQSTKYNTISFVASGLIISLIILAILLFSITKIWRKLLISVQS